MKPLAALAFCVAVTSCSTVGPDYVPPAIDLERQFAFAASPDLQVASEERWWEMFGDPTLNELMMRGLASNLDILTAQERIAEAQARYRAAGGEGGLDGDAGAAASVGYRGDDVTETSGGAVGARYVFDLFGRSERTQEAALAELQAVTLDKGTVRLAYQAELLAAYTEARYFQSAISVTQRAIASRRSVLQSVERMAASGAATELERARARAELSLAQADLPVYESALETNAVRIAVLLAEPVAPVLARLQDTSVRIAPDIDMGPGIPANLLRNRPDVLAAERRLAARFAEIGVAEAALYPSLSINGAVRIDSSTGLEIGPSLSLPLFGRDQLGAYRDAAASRAQQAELDWQAAIQQAVGEVETSLSRIDGRRAEIASLTQASRNYANLARLSREGFDLGATTLFELLDVEQYIARTEISLWRARRDYALALSQLALATGRGWRVGEIADPVMLAASGG